MPILPIDGNAITVARQHDARLIERPAGRVQVGFLARFVENKLGLDAEVREIIARKIDKRHVGVATGRIERDQALDHLDAGDLCRRHGAILITGPGPRSNAATLGS